MSAQSLLARAWPPAVLAVASSVAVGFAINYITSGGAVWWWWLVLGVGSVAGIAGIVLSAVLARDEISRSTSHDVSGGAAQQTTASGDNISINADNEGVAAWQIGQVNMGRRKKP